MQGTKSRPIPGRLNDLRHIVYKSADSPVAAFPASISA